VTGFKGIVNIGPWCLEEPPKLGKSYGVHIISDVGDLLASSAHTLDGNGNANVVVYIG